MWVIQNRQEALTFRVMFLVSQRLELLVCLWVSYFINDMVKSRRFKYFQFQWLAGWWPHCSGCCVMTKMLDDVHVALDAVLWPWCRMMTILLWMLCYDQHAGWWPCCSGCCVLTKMQDDVHVALDVVCWPRCRMMTMLLWMLCYDQLAGWWP